MIIHLIVISAGLAAEQGESKALSKVGLALGVEDGEGSPTCVEAALQVADAAATSCVGHDGVVHCASGRVESGQREVRLEIFIGDEPSCFLWSRRVSCRDVVVCFVQLARPLVTGWWPMLCKVAQVCCLGEGFCPDLSCEAQARH